MLPDTRPIDLPAGRVSLRELPGPAGAPTIVLLHGLGVTADINFYRCYSSLGERFRVLAFDHRGHGDGIRTRRPFRFADCADDVVAMADAVGVDTFVPVGYSMGGAIAQQVWRRHPQRVGGIVLCATAGHFNGTTARAGQLPRPRRARRPGPRDTAGAAPHRRRALPARPPRRLGAMGPRPDRPIGLAGGARSGCRPRALPLRPMARRSQVPVAVVMTLHDSMVPITRQRLLAESIPDVVVFPVDGDHDAVASVPQFPATLVAAIDSVIARAS